jgi:YVTN family beta-propeller protein
MVRFVLVFLLAGLLTAPAELTAAPLEKPALRQPAAMALDKTGRWLFVANRRSGTISTVDCRTHRVVEETEVGKRLADLVLLPGERGLLAVDEQKHELIWLMQQGPKLQLAARFDVQPYPVSLVVAADGSRVFVASLWSRSLSVVHLGSSATFQPGVVLPLDFAPRNQLLVDGGRKLIVADSFGGKLGILDVETAKLERVADIPGHNIRGLALDHQHNKVLVSHQILDGQAESTRQNVHWGALLTDVVRWIELDSLLRNNSTSPLENHVHQFDDQDGAGGDPAGVAVTRDGLLIQALAGVGKVAIGREWESDRARITVGQRPIAVTLDHCERLAYVADAFGDSISVIDVREAKTLATISLGSQPELTLEDRGERLFYDARLSLDGWYSCHSCHTDGHSNGLLSDNLGDGGYGAPKRVLSLLGTGDTGPWAWNGTVPTLESQIRKSIESTMQGRKPREEQVAALAAYLRTLAPPPALDPLRGHSDAAAIDRGRQLFESRGCASCHIPPSYASSETFDVGLKDELGARHFNPPSLLGVSQRAPYFHDNRATTLESALLEHRHPRGSTFSPEELRDLIAFLNSI